ncbi:MAG: PEP-CTERM sorting domain-containing protein, partial [Bryobacteraceae bacterium]
EGYFSYYTTFMLPTSYPGWNITLNVSFWADNRPEAIKIYSGSTELASVSTNYTGILGHRSTYGGGPHTLSVLGLAPGTYTIRFDTYNAKGSSGNPTGLLVRFNEATALGVPEPSTYALMGTVGLALYLLRRRKKATHTQV